MKAYSGLLFVLLCGASFVKGMERPPKHERDDAAASAAKRIRSDTVLVMPVLSPSHEPYTHQLFEAVIRGDLETVQSMLPMNRQSDDCLSRAMSDSNQRPILYFAIANRDGAMVKLLLQSMKPRRIYQLSQEFCDAIRLGGPEIATPFLPRGISEATRELFLGLLLDSEERIRRAIDAGADIVGKEGDVYRPLHVAVIFRRLRPVKLLLANGCPVNILNGDRRSALNLAAANGCEEIIEELLRAGADVNLHRAQDPTLLHLAAASDNAALARRLIEQGADVNSHQAGTEDGDISDTPLHTAASKHSLNCLKILLNNHAKVNELNSLGRTPLHDVWYDQNMLQLASLLLAHGADVNLCDNNNNTPLDDILKDYDNSDNPCDLDRQLVEEFLLWGARIQDMDCQGLQILFREKPLVLAVLRTDMLALNNIEQHTPVLLLNEALLFAIAQGKSECTEVLLRHGAELSVALQFLDTILQRPLSDQARQAYTEMHRNLMRQRSLRDLIATRPALYDVMVQNLARLPVELAQSILRGMLSYALQSRNRALTQRALEAEADISLVRVVPTVTLHPEIAHLLAPRALMRALHAGDAEGVEHALRVGAPLNVHYEGKSLLEHAAFFADAKRAHAMVKVLLQAGALVPQRILQRLDELKDRPDVALLIVKRAHELGIGVIVPWLFNELQFGKPISGVVFPT